MRKSWADIKGRNWEVGWPLCAGCPEYIISGNCAWEGNGCRYPENRTKRPINFARAFFEIALRGNKSCENLCDELGDCIPQEAK